MHTVRAQTHKTAQDFEQKIGTRIEVLRTCSLTHCTQHTAPTLHPPHCTQHALATLYTQKTARHLSGSADIALCFYRARSQKNLFRAGFKAERTALEQVERTALEQVERTALEQVERTALEQVERTALEQVRPALCSPKISSMKISIVCRGFLRRTHTSQ